MSKDFILKASLDKRPVFNKACCRDTRNLRYPFNDNHNPKTITLECKVCGAKHYRLYSEVSNFVMELGNG